MSLHESLGRALESLRRKAMKPFEWNREDSMHSRADASPWKRGKRAGWEFCARQMDRDSRDRSRPFTHWGFK
jgi:hypothetical protein